MKMAKADPADIELGLEIANILEDVDRGFFPSNLQDEDAENDEWLVYSDEEQMERLFTRLSQRLNVGSLFRVVFGMAVMCDPRNELIDPDADTLEHHPKRQKMESALLWSLYHHQGANSLVGQPIRKLLGIGQYDRLTDEQIAQAKEFGQGGAA